MRVLVNGVRLFFEANGARLVPGGPTVREKPGSHCPPIDALYRDGTAGGIAAAAQRRGGGESPWARTVRESTWPLRFFVRGGCDGRRGNLEAGPARR
jgi:hypothetical protein